MQLPLQVSSGLYTLVQMFLCCRRRIYPPFHRWPCWPPRGGPSGVHYAASPDHHFCSAAAEAVYSQLFFSPLFIFSSVLRLMFLDSWQKIIKTLRWLDCVECWGMMLHEIWVLVTVCCSLHSRIDNLYLFYEVCIKLGEVFSTAVRLSESCDQGSICAYNDSLAHMRFPFFLL